MEQHLAPNDPPVTVNIWYVKDIEASPERRRPGTLERRTVNTYVSGYPGHGHGSWGRSYIDTHGTGQQPQSYAVRESRSTVGRDRHGPPYLPYGDKHSSEYRARTMSAEGRGDYEAREYYNFPPRPTEYPVTKEARHYYQKYPMVEYDNRSLPVRTNRRGPVAPGDCYTSDGRNVAYVTTKEDADRHYRIHGRYNDLSPPVRDTDHHDRVAINRGSPPRRRPPSPPVAVIQKKTASSTVHIRPSDAVLSPEIHPEEGSAVRIATRSSPGVTKHDAYNHNSTVNVNYASTDDPRVIKKHENHEVSKIRISSGIPDHGSEFTKDTRYINERDSRGYQEDIAAPQHIVETSERDYKVTGTGRHGYDVSGDRHPREHQVHIKYDGDRVHHERYSSSGRHGPQYTADRHEDRARYKDYSDRRQYDEMEVGYRYADARAVEYSPSDRSDSKYIRDNVYNRHIEGDNDRIYFGELHYYDPSEGYGKHGKYMVDRHYTAHGRDQRHEGDRIDREYRSGGRPDSRYRDQGYEKVTTHRDQQLREHDHRIMNDGSWGTGRDASGDPRRAGVAHTQQQSRNDQINDEIIEPGVVERSEAEEWFEDRRKMMETTCKKDVREIIHSSKIWNKLEAKTRNLFTDTAADVVSSDEVDLNLSRCNFGHEMRQKHFRRIKGLFMNSASYGCTPDAVIYARRVLEDKMQENNVAWRFKTVPLRIRQAEQALADIVKANPDDLVLVPNANYASNAVLKSQPWQRGDILLVFSCDYEATLHACEWLRWNRGIEIVVLDMPLPATDEEIIDRVSALLHRLKAENRLPILANFCHVTSKSAFIFPAKDLVSLFHKYGISVMVDGAQAAGHLEIDVGDIMADYYVGTMHKWMYTCPGVGFLVVQPVKRKLIEPLVVSYFYGKAFVKQFSYTGLLDFTGYISIEYAREFVKQVCGGFAEVRRYNYGLAKEVVAYLTNRWGTVCIQGTQEHYGAMPIIQLPIFKDNPTPAHAATIMLSLMAKDMTCFVYVEEFFGRKMLVIRLACQIFHEMSDFEQLAEAIEGLGSAKPMKNALEKAAGFVSQA